MPYIKAVRDIPDIKLTEYVQAASGNYSVGRSMNNDGYNGVQTQPNLIIIHVADGKYGGTLSWFADPNSPASAHFTVAMDGRLGQSVYERDTAYHSGKWSYNVRSFGIEHEGEPSKGKWVPSEAMYEKSAALSAYLCYKYDIPADRKHIIGHSEVDPTRAARRNCPGSTWDWPRYISMVNGKIEELKRLYTNRPGHEKDDYNKPISFAIWDQAVVSIIGSGTLVAGTDKVYISSLSISRVSPGAPKLITFRNVRIFRSVDNKQVGTGVYSPATGKVYIATLSL